MARLLIVLLLLCNINGFAQDTTSYREEKLQAMTLAWLPHERAAYKQLRLAADNFIELRLLGEIGAVFAPQQSVAMYDSFAARILKTSECAIDSSTNEAFVAADKKLNEVYQKVMTLQPQKTKVGIRNAQREWIRYRDAWIAFGKIKCPQLSEETWATMITQERIAQLYAVPLPD